MAGVLQHLRSSALDKRPNPASMVDGQIAINYASGAPGMFFKDSNGSLVKVGPVHVGSGAPNAVPASGGTAGNSIGEQWLDTSGGTYVFKIWDGAAWRSEAGEFVNATGDTMTGDLVMNNANVVFEGSVDDGFETTLTVVNPTADRTITLPNVTGTVITTGDSGTVTSTMIADGTIVNADVNASAAIAGTKISPNFGSQTIQTTGIISAASGSAAAPSIAFTSDTNTGIYSPGADQVAISTNGTGRLFVDSSGRVGIGTASVYSPLTVRGLGNNITLDLNSTTTNDYSAIVWNGSTVNVTDNSTCEIRGYRVASAAGELGFHTRTAGGISQERARIDSSGRLLVGTSTSVGASGLSTPQIQFSQNGASSESITSLTTWCGTSTGFASQLHFRRSYSNTLGTHTVVVDGARLGIIRFTGSDGTDFKQAATIFAEVDGTPGTNDMPGRLVFSTRGAGASSPTERMTIDSAGNVGIGTTSPGAKLEVSGTGQPQQIIRSTDNASVSIRCINTSDSNVYFGSSGGAFRVQTNAQERIRVDSSGRLLVGTSSSLSAGNWSDSLIQVRGNSSGSTFEGKLALFTGRTIAAGIGAGESLGRVAFGNGEGGEAAWITAQADGGWSTAGSGDYPGRLVFSTTADGASSPTERMRITNDGKVGIGTTSPYSPLTIRGLGNSITLDLNSATANDYSAIAWNGSTTDVTANSTCEIRGYRVASAAGELGFHTRTAGGISQERARFSSLGQLLVGTSSAADYGDGGTATALFARAGSSQVHLARHENANGGPFLVGAKSRGATTADNVIVQNNDTIFGIGANGATGSGYKPCGNIQFQIDGTPTLSPLSMPGRLVFSTTADGASSPTEALRITNDRVVAYNQGAPAAVNATATLTVANLKTGIITSTSAAATDMTLPTGTNTEAGFSGIYTNMTFEWSVINTGPSLVRVLAGTAHTIVGSGSVATGTSGRFASRRTAANTFVTYRLS